MNLNPLNSFTYLFQQRGIDGTMFYFSVLYFKISLILEDNFKAVFIFLNLTCFILIIYFIKKFSFNIKYYFLIPTILLINYDYIVWSKYLLTDFFFSLLCLVFITNLSLKNSKKIIFFLIILLVFTRPPGIVSIFIYIQFIFLANTLENKNLLKRNFIYLVISYILLTILISYLLFYNKFPDIFNNTFQYHRSYYFEGVIINDRPHTYVELPKNIIDIINIIFLRFISFFIFYDQLFSLKHNVLNIIIFTPMYLLSFFTLFNFNSYEITQKKIILTMVLTILSFSFFHSILIIDFDWRYRIPCIIPFSILAVMSLEKLSFFKYRI